SCLYDCRYSHVHRFFLTATQTTNIYTLSLHDALPIYGENPLDIYQKARTSVDIALGRGGDQAVVKKGEDLSYFGGKNNLNLRLLDRKSTRLNSSHVSISYAVFCLKKKRQK